ncbi:MAG: hypothetical protein Q9170_002060 [Blastenia crenularia]
MTSAYDFVHTRLLFCVVQDQDPVPIIRKMWKMLKPGGWLQWDELDSTRTHITKKSSSLSTPALDALASWSQANGRHDWTVRLPSFLADEGFTEADLEYNQECSELARAFNEQHLLTAEEWAEGLVKLGNEEAVTKYFKLVEEAYTESVAGAALCVPRVVCTARKPL